MTPDERLEAIVAWAAGEPGVAGLLLVGSRARTATPADAFSDIDVLLVADDPDRWIRDDNWVRSFGRPIISFVEATQLRGRFERRVLYDDGGDVDFVPLSDADVEELGPTGSAPGVLTRGYRVLYDAEDRIGRVAGRASSAPREALPDAAGYLNAIANFWYHLVWTARKLRRAEIMVAAECLNGHMKELLVEVIRWEALAAGAADTWFGTRYMERWASAVTLERLRDCLAHYDPADIERGLWATAGLFADLAKPLAERIGVPYPADSERAARALARDVLGP